MMRSIKDRLILLLSIVVIGFFITSCCEEEPNPEERLRPALNTSTINLEVGDSAILYVLNAEALNSVTTSSQVISVQVNALSVIVKALAKGNAIIDINADGARLRCRVEVEESEVPKYDFSEELNNDQCRFVSPLLLLNYDTPGTIFSKSKDGIIEVRSLITGDHVVFYTGTAIPQEGNLPNATLQINGTSVELKQAILERISSDGSMWLNLLDTGGNRMVLVVTDL